MGSFFYSVSQVFAICQCRLSILYFSLHQTLHGISYTFLYSTYTTVPHYSVLHIPTILLSSTLLIHSYSSWLYLKLTLATFEFLILQIQIMPFPVKFSMAGETLRTKYKLPTMPSIDRSNYRLIILLKMQNVNHLYLQVNDFTLPLKGLFRGHYCGTIITLQVHLFQNVS